VRQVVTSSRCIDPRDIKCDRTSLFGALSTSEHGHFDIVDDSLRLHECGLTILALVIGPMMSN
jgi:hypothetical protein